MEQQPNNPLHGVKLLDILEYLLETQGWEEMANQVNINCFKSKQTVKGSNPFAITYKQKTRYEIQACLKFLKRVFYFQDGTQNDQRAKRSLKT